MLCSRNHLTNSTTYSASQPRPNLPYLEAEFNVKTMSASRIIRDLHGHLDRPGLLEIPSLDALSQLDLKSRFWQLFSPELQSFFSDRKSLSFNIYLDEGFATKFTATKWSQNTDRDLNYKLVLDSEVGPIYSYTLPEVEYFMLLPDLTKWDFTDVRELISSKASFDGGLWFSYMRKNIEFGWHEDVAKIRMHHVLIKNDDCASIDIENQSYRMQMNKTYVFNPDFRHRIPPQTEERLHLVATLGQISETAHLQPAPSTALAT